MIIYLTKYYFDLTTEQGQWLYPRFLAEMEKRGLQMTVRPAVERMPRVICADLWPCDTYRLSAEGTRFYDFVRYGKGETKPCGYYLHLDGIELLPAAPPEVRRASRALPDVSRTEQALQWMHADTSRNPYQAAKFFGLTRAGLYAAAKRSGWTASPAPARQLIRTAQALQWIHADTSISQARK